MKRVYIIIVTAFAFLLLSEGCNQGVDTRLSDVESGILANPDSMVVVLEGMDPGSFANERSRATHTLYLTRARHQAHIFETDDSMIREAEKFFAKNGPDEHRLIALYYIGIINNYVRSAKEAMLAAEEARKLAGKVGDDYWTAKTYDLTADIFHTTYNFPEELIYRKNAAIYFDRAGKRPNYLWALVDVGASYYDMEDLTRFFELNDSVLGLPESYDYPMVRRYCFRLAVAAYDLMFDYNNVERTLDSLIIYPPYRLLDAQERTITANLHFIRGRYAEMDSLVKESWKSMTAPEDSVRLYLLLVNYYERMGDLRMALAMEDSILAVNNRQVMYAIEQSGVAVQREVMRAEARERELEARWRGTLAWIVGGAGVVTLVCVVIILGERMRRKEMELRARMGELQQLSAEFLAAREEHTRREEEFMAEREAHSKREEALESELTERLTKNQIIMARVGKMFGEQWRMINNICASVLRKRGTKVSHTIYADLEKEFERLRSPEGVSRIAECVDTVKDGVARRLSEQAGKEIGEDGYMLAVYLLAGFSIQGASAITGVNEKTLYGRRTRLLKRIAELRHCPDKEEFLSELRPLKGERDQ